MTVKLSKSAKKVQEFILEKGLSFEVKELDSSTRTAQQAAESIGCKVEQIAKSLVFVDTESEKPILIIASGTNRVDIRKIEASAGLKLKQADGKFVKQQTGFAIGGIPPAGHLTQLRTFLDVDLMQYDEIWAAAGTPHAVFCLKPDNLDDLTKGEWVELAIRK